MSESLTFKNKLIISLTLVMTAIILFVTVIGSFVYNPVKAASGEQATKRTINVGGQGTVNATPDIAYITLGVVTEDKNAKIAQQENAKSMDKVITLIKNSGIKSEDIKTVNYSINPKYDYNKDTGESKIVGYSVNNTVQVTIRDMAKTGTIIDLATGSGVNITNNISFGLSDYEKYYNQALKKAVETAKKRAETMADTLGITLKSPVTVSENGGYTPSYDYGIYNVKAEAAAATPIQTGSLEIKANINMVYEY